MTTQDVSQDMPQETAQDAYRDLVTKYSDRKLATAIEFMTTWQRTGAPATVDTFLEVLHAEAALRRAEDQAQIEPEVWS